MSDEFDQHLGKKCMSSFLSHKYPQKSGAYQQSTLPVRPSNDLKWYPGAKICNARLVSKHTGFNDKYQGRIL